MKISKPKPPIEKIKMRTKANSRDEMRMLPWWEPEDEEAQAQRLVATAAYLKTNQIYRIRQQAVDIRMYANLSVYSYAGSNVSKMDQTKTLPDDKPTFNLVQSCIDTLVSRIGQNEPQPKFLTDNADYKQRHLGQQLNNFVLGEFYQTKFYDKSKKMLRIALAGGTGALKFYPDNDKVCVDSVLTTNLYVDDNDAIDGDPQMMLEVKLMERDKVIAKYADSPSIAKIIEMVPNSYPDNNQDSARTISDQIMVVEGWKKASGPDPEARGYIPGKHIVATVAGYLEGEVWHKDYFPFVFLKYSDPFLGFWGQGIATQLFGTQMALNRIMYTIARAITLVGVPRIFIEKSSKVVKAHNNNEVGVIITYSGTKPEYEVAPCNAPELYSERDKLIAYGFQQTGVSSMQATSAKPQGLDSGEAIRANDDISTDRFASLAKKYDNIFVESAYLITDIAKDIAKKTGKYQTVYPNKDGTKEIDLPAMKFLEDPFVIKCFTESALPRTPAGRIQTVTEQVQAGMLTLKEGRRLMRFPDLEQNEQLDNASEERIFMMLDSIVEKGKYIPPDMFLDLDLATTLTVQYLNLYLAANLEEKKANLLRKFFKQVQTLKQAAQPPAMPPGAAAGGPAPQALPETPPTSPLIPNSPNPVS